MNGFRKRTYPGAGAFLADLRFILGNLSRVRAILGGSGISPDFRERLMLAVTRVNECRHCARFHARAALAEGISREEVDALLKGAHEDCPPDQLTGVLYAEHWAEMQGMPDAEIRGRLVAEYGEGTAGDIDIALRIVKTGNLAGNTVDGLLHRISFGRWGLGRTVTDKDVS